MEANVNEINKYDNLAEIKSGIKIDSEVEEKNRKCNDFSNKN